MLDIPFELKNLEMPESKWVKSLRTRMRVFNTQIFNDLFPSHSKDNATMNYGFLEKSFNRLYELALYDNSISSVELIEFVNDYETNLQKLYDKKLEKIVVPQMA